MTAPWLWLLIACACGFTAGAILMHLWWARAFERGLAEFALKFRAKLEDELVRLMTAPRKP